MVKKIFYDFVTLFKYAYYKKGGFKMNPKLRVPSDETVVKDFYDGLKEGGVDFASYLPDSVLYPLISSLESDDEVTTISCFREDEGVAIAAGSYLGGKTPVVMTESSGVGYSPLILARTQLQRTPMLILASHSYSLGVQFDYLGASRLVGEGVFKGLSIPYKVMDDSKRVKTFVKQALATVQSQKTSVGLIVPEFVMGGA